MDIHNEPVIHTFIHRLYAVLSTADRDLSCNCYLAVWHGAGMILCSLKPNQSHWQALPHNDQSAQHQQIDIGSLVFEEDSTGDAMYVVLSGECDIRARPAHAASIPQQQSQPISTVLAGPHHKDGAHDSDSCSSEEDEEPSSASLPPRIARSEAEHSSSFWIHKYMQQVLMRHSPAHFGLVLQVLLPDHTGFLLRTNQQHVHIGRLGLYTVQEPHYDTALCVLMRQQYLSHSHCDCHQ